MRSWLILLAILFLTLGLYRGLAYAAGDCRVSRPLCSRAEVQPVDWEVANDSRPDCFSSIQNCLDDFVQKYQIDAIAGVVRLQKSQKLERLDLFDPKNRKLAESVSALGFSRAASQSLATILASQEETSEVSDVWELMATLSNSCAEERSSSRWSQKAVLCGLRYNRDLWRYDLLESWPGCECAGDAKSREFKGTCVSGLTPDLPIDERFPKSFEVFIDRLQAWAAQDGSRVKTVQMIDCLKPRLTATSRGGGAKMLSLWDVSAHAEGRACDMKSITFEKDGKPWVWTVQTPNGRAGFSAAVASFFAQREEPSMANRYMRLIHQNKGPIPIGVPDHEALWQRSQGPKPAKMKDADWQSFRTGLAVQRMLIDSGFYVLDAHTDHDHESHFHVVVGSRAKDWAIMQPGSSVGIEAKIALDEAILEENLGQLESAAQAQQH